MEYTTQADIKVGDTLPFKLRGRMIVVQVVHVSNGLIDWQSMALEYEGQTHSDYWRKQKRILKEISDNERAMG
jgi:hypothetical protein